MLFYYIRHGDPVYDPDSLTPLGHRQAEALAKRLSVYGLDEIYTSTSNRAMLTAKPTCEMLKIEPKPLDFANEKYTWEQLTIEREDGGEGVTWLFYNKRTRELFNSKEIRDLGDRWFDHPAFEGRNYESAIKRVYDGADGLLSSLGYEHDRYTGKYRSVKPNGRRVALFAHQGFGLAFLSCLLDIPYPMFCTHFDITPTGMTVIEFQDFGGVTVPKVLIHSSDSHIYREGLPLRYEGVLRV
ncbi:MAG: histidine phosphatase family protein [Clostridia bacterium]|nr:histidine phosphatase family protein [Clostridia bacterium]